MPALKPLAVEVLRTLAAIDALVYGFSFDSGSRQVTLSIGIDSRCEIGIAELGLAEEGEVIVELSFHGVQSASVRSAVPRSAAVEPDEPPQEYEIATWSVKSRSFRNTHTLEIRCYLGTVFTIEFASAAIGLSELKPGQRHEYPPVAPNP